MANPISEKIHIFDYVPIEKKSVLEKGVVWYKNGLYLPETIKKVVAIAGSVVLSIASAGLLLPLVFTIKDLSYKVDLETAAKKFYDEVQNHVPPSDDPIELKSETQTFNHVNDYLIKDGILWYRRRDKSEHHSWKPLFFDGELTGHKPVKISADGANLNVIDDIGAVHYRKVLIEGRGYEEIHKPRFKRHIENANFDLDQNDKQSYVAIDKTEKINWKDHWYNFAILPGGFAIIHRIVNFISGKRLIPEGIIAMAHRGRFANGYSDINGNFHPTATGVTTSYEFQPLENRIRKHDPWAPIWSKVYIYFPKSEEKAFVAKKVDASGSTLAAIGYDANLKTRKGKLKILINLCDIDTSGNNPGLKYAYQANQISSEEAKLKEIRILPDDVKNEGWEEHLLPKDAQVIYDQITIFQTGSGNEKRELRVGAKNVDGQLGYYRKTLEKNSDWQFVPYPNVDTSTPLAKSAKLDDLELGAGINTYKGSIQKTNGPKTEAILKDFGEKAYHSHLKLKIDQKVYKLALHKRLGWKTFLGIKHEVFELVIPKQRGWTKLANEFGGRRVIPVNIETLTKKGQTFLKIAPKGKHPIIPYLQ